MKLFDSKYIDNELSEIGKRVKKPLRIYLIGGCAMSFRGLKEATKDVDIVFGGRKSYEAFCHALFGAQYFEQVKITGEHERLEATAMYENRDGFHLDLFVRRVCGKMELSDAMEMRAEFHRRYGKVDVYLVAKEDIFLFKALASESRKRDLADMQAIYPDLDWKAMEKELRSQKLSEELVEHMARRLEEFSRAYRLDVPFLKKLKTKK